ncbi:hypothetical protein LEA_06752 [human gut metagenome]|uniref:Uncharacterized protein n=1 Tax=human gut metagenome TaxID=408170 RepID=K1TXT7_9ZZZZ
MIIIPQNVLKNPVRDIGWNYLQSTLPNSIIINYGDNDTFPLWNNQESTAYVPTCGS